MSGVRARPCSPATAHKSQLNVFTIIETKFWGNIDGEVLYDEDNDKLLYTVYNLNDCPEDAVISRDLISTYEYVEILRKGMELAKQGYDGIALVEEESCE